MFALFYGSDYIFILTIGHISSREIKEEPQQQKGNRLESGNKICIFMIVFPRSTVICNDLSGFFIFYFEKIQVYIVLKRGSNRIWGTS